MRLAYAFFAKYADTAQDGGFAVFGGGFTVVGGNEFPFPIPTLAVIIHLLVRPADCNRQHRLVLEAFGPAGDVLPFRAETEFTPGAHAELPHREVGFTSVVNMVGFPIQGPGDYAFRILLDGQPVDAPMLTLTVVHRLQK